MAPQSQHAHCRKPVLQGPTLLRVQNWTLSFTKSYDWRYSYCRVYLFKICFHLCVLEDLLTLWRRYGNGIVDLDMFTLGAIATGGDMNPSGNLSYKKITLVGWMSGSWTQRDGITLAEGLRSSKSYLRIQPVPQRKHNTSPLRRSVG
jgi:hypothetical protein